MMKSFLSAYNPLKHYLNHWFQGMCGLVNDINQWWCVIAKLFIIQTHGLDLPAYPGSRVSHTSNSMVWWSALILSFFLYASTRVSS